MAKEKIKMLEDKKKSIQEFVKEFQKKGRPLINVESIVNELKMTNGIIATQKEVRKVLKNEMGLRYLKAKKLHPNANSTRVMIQRQ